MKYNIQTVENAIKTLKEFLNLNDKHLRKILKKIMDSENKDIDYFIDSQYKIYKNEIQKNYNSDLEIVLYHYTSVTDECSSIKERGLLNLNKMLSMDNSFSKFILDNGFKYDSDNKKIDYIGDKIVNDTTNVLHDPVSHKIQNDSFVNGFLCIEDVNKYSSISLYPEFLYNLYMKYGIDLGDMWRKNSKLYRIEFHIYPYQECDYGEEKLKKILFEKIIRMIIGKYDRDKMIFGVDVKYDVPPSQIISCTRVLRASEV